MDGGESIGCRRYEADTPTTLNRLQTPFIRRMEPIPVSKIHLSIEY